MKHDPINTLELTVLPEHVANGKRENPFNCVVALALGSDEVIVNRCSSRVHGQWWEHPPELVKQIMSFDNLGVFAPGVYVLTRRVECPTSP